MGFVFRAVDEVGAALNCALVVMGDKLGYYRALADHGPTTAGRAGPADRHRRAVRHASGSTPRPPGGFVTYDPATRAYTLPAEHAVALTDESSPAYLPGFFQIAFGTVADAAASSTLAPRRRRPRLGRAQHRRPRGLRALLPARVRRQPRRRVAAGARRGRRQAASAAPGSPTSAAVTEPRPSSWRGPSRSSTFVGSDDHAGVGRDRPGAGRRGRGGRPRSSSRPPRPRRSPVAATTS